MMFHMESARSDVDDYDDDGETALLKFMLFLEELS